MERTGSNGHWLWLLFLVAVPTTHLLDCSLNVV
jgi:hypothetical protein